METTGAPLRRRPSDRPRSEDSPASLDDILGAALKALPPNAMTASGPAAVKAHAELAPDLIVRAIEIDPAEFDEPPSRQPSLASRKE
jgi:hypothetical protein